VELLFVNEAVVAYPEFFAREAENYLSL